MAGLLGEADAPAGGVDRADPGAGDGERERDHAGVRHEFREPGKGDSFAVGGGRGDGGRGRADGAAAGAHRAEPRVEVLLSSEDIRGEQAEAYGYVNRALADAELDGFVEALAMGIAAFDKWAIATTKRLVNTGLPPEVEIGGGWDACIASLGRPAAAGWDQGEALAPSTSRGMWRIAWDIT